MLRNHAIWVAALAAAAGVAPAQDQLLSHSSIAINLPPDSPLTLISSDTGESRASARGGAMVLDLHMSLKLRNNSPQRVRGITMIVAAQEVTPGGRGSFSQWLNVGSGEVFPQRNRIKTICSRSCWRLVKS